MKIKICGLRDNFEEVLALKPDFVGMIFYPKSPRYVGECQDERLKRRLTDTKKVGVFVNANYETIIKAAGEYNLDAIQLHGGETPQLCEFLRQDFIVIKAFSIATVEDLAKLEAYEGVVDYFLFDTKTPGYGGSTEIRLANPTIRPNQNSIPTQRRHFIGRYSNRQKPENQQLHRR